MMNSIQVLALYVSAILMIASALLLTMTIIQEKSEAFSVSTVITVFLAGTAMLLSFDVSLNTLKLLAGAG